MDETEARSLSQDRVTAGFVAGEAACTAEAYRRWRPLVQALARRALGDDRDAEDVVQLVFLAAWCGRDRYRPGPGGLGAWLTGITRHKIADALAARARQQRLAAAEAARLAVAAPDRADAPGPERTLARLVVLGELARLPSAQQQVLRLAFYAGLTQSEIADRTGLPLGTVKSRMRRALLVLRDALAPAEPAASAPR